MAQIPFACYQEFFPEKTHKELIEFYSITGGVPKYIELFEDSVDIYTAIEKNVLSKQSFLYEDICLQKMRQLGATNELPFMADKIGRWWDNKNEIDIVAYDSKGSSIMFGECKYANQKTANITDDAYTVRKESHFISQVKQGVPVAHAV